MSTTIRSIINGLATRLAAIDGTGSYGTDLDSRVYKPWLAKPEGAQRPCLSIDGYTDTIIDPSLSTCGARTTTIRLIGHIATDGADSDDTRADRACQLAQDIGVAIAADSTLGIPGVHCWVARETVDLGQAGLKDGQVDAYLTVTWIGTGGSL